MQLSGKWLVAERLVTITLYRLLRLVFIIAQRIYWQLNGTARKLREARLPHNYERSAHVLDVLYYQKFCPMQMADIDNFLYTHNRFENPQYIIDNDNISLFTITEHDAIFCEPQDKGMHLWRLKYGAFLHVAQMKYIRHLIAVPLSTFHRLAETIGDPKSPIIFQFFVPRSGSTLLNQIMEYTERCVSVSEPTSPFLVTMKYVKSGDSPELRQLARDVIRWECRPYPTMQLPPLCYFVKLTSFAIFALPLFKELFPSSRCLFAYRDVVKIAQSFNRSLKVTPWAFLIFGCAGLSPRLVKMLLDFSGLHLKDTDFTVCLDNNWMPGVWTYAIMTNAYLDMRRRGFDVRAVCYEDLVARPLDMCRVILENCQLPVSLAELAVKAFDVDSQRNSVLSKENVGRFRTLQMTPEIKANLDEFLMKNKLPLIGEPGIIEGTITCP